MNVLKRIQNYGFTVSIIYIIIGLIMVINPQFVCDAINYIVGFFIIIFGILYLINQYTDKVEVSKFNFLAGLLCISFGIFLVLNTDILVSMIPFCSGIIILMDSIYQFKNSVSLKKYGEKKWWINLVVAIFFFLFALYVIAYAKDVTYLIIRIIGIILILDGVMDIYSYIGLKKYTDNTKVIDVYQK